MSETQAETPPLLLRIPRTPWRLAVSLEVKAADLWIGAYYRREPNGWSVWVCLLPCLPIHLSAWREWWRND